MKDFSKDPLNIAVIGAGVMGRGIAQLAASVELMSYSMISIKLLLMRQLNSFIRCLSVHMKKVG